MEIKSGFSSSNFGEHVFNRTVMKRVLPSAVFKNILNAMEGKEKIKAEYADTIASAMKDWALGFGATHYTHWFQPQTGLSAEKHDAFIDWGAPDVMIEKFSGKQLIQGEPDASSFPSGGLRTTYEARGYTGWDPSSPAFIWMAGGGIVLCIPSVFFSWTGDVLDNKIPLLRSEHKISEAVLRLLKLTGIKAEHIMTTIGLEQEYFVLDREIAHQRIDLLLSGRSVFGSPPAKGQELQDHYFGAVKERILSFMDDFESEAVKLGIPVKTRHNEVAPAQHEIAPSVERASIAVDHNILLMELMRKIGVKHDLKVLLHEKPFAGINGSGKHCNWSLATDTGLNLLHPTENTGDKLYFLILLTAVLDAVYNHSVLLRAAIGSASNDYRLGGHEAPPAIMSVYLGQELESLLNHIEEKGVPSNNSGKKSHDLAFHLPHLDKDNTDRNRTSPFAFTGNKFEFRAVGSSSNPAFAITVLNTIVAESLIHILDEIEGSNAIEVIQAHLKKSKPIRFSGDNYSKQWMQEAKKRHLPNIEKAIHSYPSFIAPQTIQAFKGVLNENELRSRFEIAIEQYAATLDIEFKLMIEMCNTQILPAAIKYQKMVAKSICECRDFIPVPNQEGLLKNLSTHIEACISLVTELDEERKRASEQVGMDRARALAEPIFHKAEQLRKIVDTLENLIDNELWPFPKYRELLFLV